MSSIHWYPADYVDETCPSDQHVHPNGWLHQMHDGSWYAGPPMPDLDRSDLIPIKLTESQIVSFLDNEVLGVFLLKVDADGHSWPEGAPPVGATHFWEAGAHDPDTICDTAEMMADLFREFDGIGAYGVEAYRWGAGTDFRFEVADGVGRFVEVAPAAQAAE